MFQNNQDKRQQQNNPQRQANTSVSHIYIEERSQISKGLSFVFRKSEKLTTALYMVTDIMFEREPMKWKMRETAVELLTGVTTAMNATPGEKMTALGDVLKKIERIISFLEIASASRMLSEMNATVLKKEYSVLKTSVEYEWSKIFDRDKGILNEGYFNVHEESKGDMKLVGSDEAKPVVKQTPSASLPVRYIPPLVEKQNVFTEDKHTAVLTSPTPHAPVTTQRVSERGERHAPMQIHKERMHGVVDTKEQANEYSQHSSDDLLPERGRVESGKNDRRTIILALIKQKPNLGVKDFIKSIPDVSEKTIQRELLAMVAEGLLVKKGERRWSTYSLA